MNHLKNDIHSNASINSPMGNKKNEKLSFAPRKDSHLDIKNKHDITKKPWKVMIIDDEEVVHSVSKMVLDKLSYNERRIKIIQGYSAADGRRLLAKHSDTAVLLLDVVMETDNAGLELVKYIREVLKNPFLRIVLRTGQPGQAPEHEVISKYDINDYKEKSELTAQKLHSTIIVTLRAFDDLKKIETLSMDKTRLESIVQERTKNLRNVNTALNLNMEHLSQAQRIAKIGHWEWLVKENQFIFSPQIRQIIGITKDYDNTQHETLTDLVPIEARKELINAIEGTVKKRIPYECEHLINRPDGIQLFVRHQTEPVIDENGDVTMLIGTMQDITTQHEAIIEMRKLSGAINQAADAIMITDVNGKIEYINPAFKEMTGFSGNELIGKSPSLLKSGKQSLSFYKRMWKIIKKGEAFKDIVINRRKNGTLYYEEKTITPIKEENGNITSFISTGHDITDRMEAQQELFHLAHHDALTGLPNRALLQDRLTQVLTRIKQNKRHIAVLFIDLDRFKIINDTLGHDTGDKLLKNVSERLVECVREGDTIARLGGDEFAVILNDVAKKEDIEPIAQKMLEQIATPFNIHQHELFISASIGIVFAPENGEETLTLLKKADKAMYLAKESGKNKFQFYTSNDQKKAIKRLMLETALRRALQKQEFILQYQPQVDVKTGNICGVEALLRWQQNIFDNISPEHFIPLLEETGMIVDVGEWVLRTSCLQAVEWKKQGNNLRVSVNLSARQFQQAEFVEKISSIIKETGVDTNMLELEITEGMLIHDIDKTTKALKKFHDMGIRIAVDDFGTGFSSMNYLKQLPVNVLKIDRCFIKDINNSPNDESIATGMIHLAHSLNLEVIAEGVDSIEQLVLLKTKGIDQIQGFLYSKPLPPDEIETLINNQKSRWEIIFSQPT